MRSTSAGQVDLCLLASLLLFGAAACNQVDAAPKNVLVVSIDTLRADHVGTYGARQARTPTIDRLAREGVRFDAAFSPAPLTLPSHSTLMTGADPHRHGVRHNGIHRLGDAATTLAERFAEAGYSTGAAVGSQVIGAHTGLAQGFDDYDDRIAGFDDHATGTRRADAVNAAAFRWLDRTSGPFFLFVHYYDPHRPYRPPVPYAESAPTPYDGEIAYADAMLGELLEHLESKGQLEATWIVVTSDHGEGLGEHDELTHSTAIYDATQRVPLVIRGPGLAPGRVVPQIVRTADIAPTLLSLLGLPPLEAIDGEDLGPLLRGETAPDRIAYLETLATRFDYGWSPLYGLRTREHLFIRAPQPELYDVASDPAQRTNLLEAAVSDEDRALAAHLERELDARLAEEVVAERKTLDPATLAQLHALGYAVSEAPVEENGLDPKVGRKSLALLHEGDELYEAGRAAEAALRYEAMLRISPDSGLAWISLGAARLDAGQLEEAYEATRKGLEKAPGHGSSWIQLGVVEMARGRPAEAEACFRHAIELSPEAPGGHLRLVTALVAQGKLDAARELDRRVAELEWANEVWLRRLADFWEAAGETETALEDYRRVLARVPDSERDHMHAAIALIRLGRLAEARPHLESAGDVARQPKAQKAFVAALRERGLTEQANRFLQGVPPAAALDAGPIAQSPQRAPLSGARPN